MTWLPVVGYALSTKLAVATPLPAAVNVSMLNLLDHDFPDRAGEPLARRGIRRFQLGTLLHDAFEPSLPRHGASVDRQRIEEEGPSSRDATPALRLTLHECDLHGVRPDNGCGR